MLTDLTMDVSKDVVSNPLTTEVRMDESETLKAKPATMECVVATARRFNLPIRLLLAIRKVEGGIAGKTSSNTNGTYDMGPMQINSIWLSKFEDFTSKVQIVYNGCINMQVGAWILRYSINEAGDFWEGVGNYHSRTKDFHRRYIDKVYQASETIGGIDARPKR